MAYSENRSYTIISNKQNKKDLVFLSTALYLKTIIKSIKLKNDLDIHKIVKKTDYLGLSRYRLLKLDIHFIQVLLG